MFFMSKQSSMFCFFSPGWKWTGFSNNHVYLPTVSRRHRADMQNSAYKWISSVRMWLRLPSAAFTWTQLWSVLSPFCFLFCSLEPNHRAIVKLTKNVFTVEAACLLKKSRIWFSVHIFARFPTMYLSSGSEINRMCRNFPKRNFVVG